MPPAESGQRHGSPIEGCRSPYYMKNSFRMGKNYQEGYALTNKLLHSYLDIAVSSIDLLH